MKKNITATAIPTYALKSEALAGMSASFERFCLAAGIESLTQMLVTVTVHSIADFARRVRARRRRPVWASRAATNVSLADRAAEAFAWRQPCERSTIAPPARAAPAPVRDAIAANGLIGAERATLARFAGLRYEKGSPRTTTLARRAMPEGHPEPLSPSITCTVTVIRDRQKNAVKPTLN